MVLITTNYYQPGTVAAEYIIAACGRDLLGELLYLFLLILHSLRPVGTKDLCLLLRSKCSKHK
jgi:hypothetical protein